MKVVVKRQGEEFRPITLTIDIESEEEFEVLAKLFQSDVSIPDSLYRKESVLEKNGARRIKLQGIMGAIYARLSAMRFK